MGSQRPVPLVTSLDLEMQDAFITINEHHMTSLPGLWAAGDLCSPRAQQVVMAAAQGGLAGTMINMALMNH
jgi:thioredoxin reductase